MPLRGVGSFIGRSRELAELAALARSRSGLVVVWGSGGAGKTALARRFADGLRADGVNVLWFDVADARSTSDLVALLAAGLGIALDAAEGGTIEAEAARLARSIEAHDALVVADNVEQLDASARALLGSVAAGGARLLVTSRELDPSTAARALRIDPLPEEDALALWSELSGSEVDDAARAIVRRLDALPLAIELAAARAALLGNQEILARLDRKLDFLGGPAEPDRPARHATLRATIAWSWELLDEIDCAALAACAAFEGPFDALLAASALAIDELAAIDAIERLRQRALVHLDARDEEGRPQLRLLEAVRDFVRATEAYASSRERYAAAVVARTEPLAAVVERGGLVPPALARRRADLLALTRSTTARETDHATIARAALSLAALLGVTGPLDRIVERTGLARKALEGSRATEDRALATRLAIAQGEALRAMGRLDDAAVAASAALTEAAADLPDAPLLEAAALRLAGAVARSRGEADRAVEVLTAGVDRLRAHGGSRALTAICIGELGAAFQSQGRLDLAVTHHAEAVALHVAEGSVRAEGVARSYLAVATHRRGEPAAALPLHEAALALHRKAGHLRLEGAELLHLGYVHHELGAPAPARTAFAEARRVLTAAGAPGLVAFALVFAARLEADEGNEEAARVQLAEAERIALDLPRSSRLTATRHLVAGHLAFARGAISAALAAYEAAWSTNRDVEVGFEALTPAYLALARARTSAGEDAIRSAIEDARPLAARMPNLHIGAAFAILEGGVSGTVAPEAADAIAASSEVRRALAFVGARRAMVVSAEARRIVLPDGREVDLSRRKNVRLVLGALIAARSERPGSPVTAETLLHVGWPGERMRAEAATKRLHTAIWTLRSLGFEAVIVSSEEGYFLDPRIRVDQA